MQLKNKTSTLVDGVSQLKDGAMQLSDGLKKLKDEGISKITEAVPEDLQQILTRVRATADVSKHYRNFSGLSNEMDGQIRFVYRTEEVN